MEKQPQFPFAPKDFARCLNATCPRSQNCLRRTAALQDTDEHLFLKVVNPWILFIPLIFTLFYV